MIKNVLSPLFYSTTDFYSTVAVLQSERLDKQFAFFDFSGGLVKSLMAIQNQQPLDEVMEFSSVELTKYLSDKNKKKHFFVIPYAGDATVTLEGISYESYLSTAANYIFSQSTSNAVESIDIIVTKADGFCVEKSVWDVTAEAFVKQRYQLLYNQLEEMAHKTGCVEPKIYSYSLGEKLTREVVRYNPTGFDRLKDSFLNDNRSFFSKLVAHIIN